MRNKNNLSIEDVFEQYSELIFRYCFARINNHYHDAEEITHEVIVILCQKWHQLKKDNILAWLYRCTDMYIKKYRTKKHKESKYITYIEDLSRSEEPAAEAEYNPYIFDKDINQYIEDICQMLSDSENKLFDCRYKKRMTLMEIAAFLKMPYSTLHDKIKVLDKKIQILVREITENSTIN